MIRRCSTVGKVAGVVGTAAWVLQALVEQHVAVVRRTYCECPDWAELLHELLRGGVAALASRCSMRVGVPLRPMLAHPTRAVRDVLARYRRAASTTSSGIPRDDCVLQV